MMSRPAIAGLVAIVIGCAFAAIAVARSGADAQGIEQQARLQQAERDGRLKRAAAGLRAARAKCETRKGAERGNCKAEARAQYRRATKEDLGATRAALGS
jgi:hypothetical protein